MFDLTNLECFLYNFVYRYQAPSNVEQPKQHTNYQQQPIKPARVPYNAVNEGALDIATTIINNEIVKYNNF